MIQIIGKICVDKIKNTMLFFTYNNNLFQLLLAGKMYDQGHGDTAYVEKAGKTPQSWTAVKEISTALNSAFYSSFKVCVTKK